MVEEAVALLTPTTLQFRQGILLQLQSQLHQVWAKTVALLVLVLLYLLQAVKVHSNKPQADSPKVVRLPQQAELAVNPTTVLLVAEAEPQATQEMAGMVTTGAVVIHHITALVAEALVGQATDRLLTGSVVAEVSGTKEKAQAVLGEVYQTKIVRLKTTGIVFIVIIAILVWAVQMVNTLGILTIARQLLIKAEQYITERAVNLAAAAVAAALASAVIIIFVEAVRVV
ncbi:MAG: hypothetical protein CL995_05480 [Euryarchaeota archaeon]|nr:hypothetical protein [Euryarchaeota archaeon]